MELAQINKLKQKTAYLSIFSNTLLVILKLAVGIYIGAMSLISEAMHSGVDLLAALIAFWAVRKAAVPPDQKYDYGYGKYENLSSAIEALLIILAALMIVYEAIDRFHEARPIDNIDYGIWIMVVSIIVNLLVSQRLISVAKKTGSQALEADGLHLRSDVWTSVGVLLGLFAMQILHLYWLDSVVAVVVASIIFHAGYKMVIKSAKELTDASLSADYEHRISVIFMRHNAVLGYHHLRTRSAGIYKMIDAHINFNYRMTLGEVHAACDEIEAQIRAELGPTVDITLHPEPLRHDEKTVCHLDERGKENGKS